MRAAPGPPTGAKSSSAPGPAPGFLVGRQPEAGHTRNELLAHPSVFLSLGGQKLGERSQETVDLGSRVVMDKAHPEYSAQGFDSHSFGEVERVKISVPGEDAAIAQKRGQFGRRALLETEGDGGAAFMEALRIGDAEKAQAG